MAFGYSLMKGRSGASGYIRETGDQREVSVRDVVPGTVCTLYRQKGNEWEFIGNETAGSGGAKWTVAKEGSVFLAADNKVLLWEGGDEAFLLANEWLKKQIDRNKEKCKEEEMPEVKEAVLEEPAQTAGNSLETGTEETKQTEVYKEQEQTKVQSGTKQRKQTKVCSDPPEKQTSDYAESQTKENPPERAYTLRPAGKGEPVDTLTERWET